MFRQPLRCHLDLFKPDIQSRVNRQQERQKIDHDYRAKERSFKTGHPVYVKNFAQRQPWICGTVDEVPGPLSYNITVNLEDGRIQL